jgi:hypothetical protein
MLLLQLVLVCVAAATLSKLGATNSYISGAAAFSFAVRMNLDIVSTTTLVVGAYLTSYFIGTELELDGASSELQTALVDSSELTTNAKRIITWLRILIVLVFVLLPIPKPAAYISGLNAVVLVSVLVISIVPNRELLRGGIVVLVQTVLLLICLKLVNSSMPVPAMIGGMAIANNGIDESNDEVRPPGLIRLMFMLAIAWLTPGLTLGLIGSAILPSSRLKSVWILLASSAIEGWTLHVCLAGYNSSKSMLGDLLSQVLFIKPDAHLYMCVAIAIACSIVVYRLFMSVPCIDKSRRELSLSLLLLQGVMAVGWWMLLFLAVGYVVKLVMDILDVKSKELLSISMFVPIIGG